MSLYSIKKFGSDVIRVSLAVLYANFLIGDQVSSAFNKYFPELNPSSQITGQRSLNPSQKNRVSSLLERKKEKDDQKEQEQFPDINWILHKEGDRVVYGDQPREKDSRPLSLEEIVFTEKNPINVRLTTWEVTTLARLIPLKRMIEKQAHNYNINPMWATMFFNYESLMDPLDRNMISDDFGLGQIKRDSEKLAKQLGKDPSKIYYSTELDGNKSIYDPETNIILSMILHRYNIRKYGLKNSDQLYAIYVRGEDGLNYKGNPSIKARKIVNSMRGRYLDYQNVIPLFRIDPEQIKDIKCPDTRRLMELYWADVGPEATYTAELEHFLDKLERGTTGSISDVMDFSNCVMFTRILDRVWNLDQKHNYRRLSDIASNMQGKVKNGDTQRRFRKAYVTLISSMYTRRINE